MSSAAPDTWMDRAFWKSIQVNGAKLPDRKILNLVGSVTGADNAGNGSTDVTITLAPSEDQVALTVALASAALVTGRMYVWNPVGAGFSQPLPTAPTRGMRFGFCDPLGLWVPSGAHNLTLDPGANKVIDPHCLNTVAPTSTTWKTTPGVVLDSPYATVWVTWCPDVSVWRVE